MANIRAGRLDTLYPLPMAQLRLFANLREIAGTSRVEIVANTVGGILDVASDRYGPEFRRGLESARVWVNGETAAMDQMVDSADEVVLIPPVSGGSQPVSTIAPADLLVFLPVAIGVVAVLANTLSQEIWAAALVAIAAAWAVDIGSVFRARGRAFASLAIVVASAGSAMAAHVMGGAGYGLSVVVAVAVGLGWAVVIKGYRNPAAYGSITVVSLFAGLGTASMVLARSAHSPDDAAADAFLAAVIVGVALGSVVERLPAVPLVDPFSVTAIAAVLAAIGAATLWDLDVVGYLLVGLGVAVALVAGRGFASMLRTGRVGLTERPPGILASMDGVVLAAAVYYPLLVIIL
jgi:molybdopterin converting factor small subunit